jgi:7-keto-8-aminopelargonate synthetase-like enzyme
MIGVPCASAPVRDYLVNRGRGFIFSTAPSPLMARGVREALRILAPLAGRGQPLPPRPEDAGGVRLVHDHHRIVPLGHRHVAGTVRGGGA